MKNILFSPKTIITAASACILLSFTSCNNELEVIPYSYFTSTSFFTNMNEANMATLGVYEPMSAQETYGQYMSMVFDADTDIAQMSGFASDDWRVIPHYQGISQTTSFYYAWSLLYTGIDRANLVIEKIPVMDLYANGTQAQKDLLNRYLGEAKFLRGFYASELVKFWGDVPFKTKSSQAGDNLKVGLVDRQQIYDQAIKDMQEATLLLPTETPTNERLNKWGAKAMLARVALYAGGYSLSANGTMTRPSNYKDYYRIAQTEINDIMAHNPYKLNPSYSKVYKNQCQNLLDPTENIFQVALYSPLGNPGNAGTVGAFNSVNTAKGVYQTSNGRCLALRPFYSSFNAADQRRDFSVATYTLAANGNKKVLEIDTRQDEQWTCGKYSREYQTYFTAETSNTSINWVIMRYADLLLMRAEVENELNEGPNAIAYAAINQVRRRAYGLDIPGSRIAITLGSKGTGYNNAENVFVNITGGGGSDAAAAVTLSSGRVNKIVLLRSGDGYTSVPTVTITSSNGIGSGATATATLLPKPSVSEVELPLGLTKDNFLKAIQQERAWELSFEGSRRTDLIRWGILGTKIAETKEKTFNIRSNYFYPAGTYFVSGKHELYPFPQNEKDVNKNITRQNPQY